MKITELEHLKEGDYLIIKPLAEFRNPLVQKELQTLRVQFRGFKNGDGKKMAILRRNLMTHGIPVDEIEVISRYRGKS